MHTDTSPTTKTYQPYTIHAYTYSDIWYSAIRFHYMCAWAYNFSLMCIWCNQQCYGNHRKKTKIFTRNLVQHFNLLCNNGVCLCLCADAGTDEICIRLVALSYVFLGLGIHNSGSDIIIRPELKNCIAIQLTQTNHRTWFWKWVKLYKFPLLHSPVMCVCVCVCSVFACNYTKL